LAIDILDEYLGIKLVYYNNSTIATTPFYTQPYVVMYVFKHAANQNIFNRVS